MVEGTQKTRPWPMPEGAAENQAVAYAGGRGRKPGRGLGRRAVRLL
jgi:hypothetical protein